jgi:NAD(P)H-dependent flavin oxidoreductase YrpB (nitropropane dioxygenase family)
MENALLKPLPSIIQGGMGVAVSGWRLAKTVSQLGHLGVVSGTAVSVTMAHRLQQGDPGGHLRRALAHFPSPDIAERVLTAYFLSGGKAPDVPYRSVPMPSLGQSRAFLELALTANFAEVFLAKEGHHGVVGVNLLEKIQLLTLPSLLGAMMAGVDYVLMGAGIPLSIPGVLDDLAAGRSAKLKLDVRGDTSDQGCVARLDPQAVLDNASSSGLKRPRFLGIVSSSTLAMGLARKSTGRVDGFVVEGPTAGGHNAPPRGRQQVNPEDEPVYGPRDAPDLDKIARLGLPFWLAGSYGRPARLAEARALGASGIQVGTAFAFCAESGLSSELKRRAVDLSLRKEARVFTDPAASPTGFPFKVVQMSGTLSEASVYEARTRTCNFGYLRHLYRRPDGSVGYRCPSEPSQDYLEKGGTLEETVGRKCICNGLLASTGLGQVQSPSEPESPLVTAGDDIGHIADFLPSGQQTYSAKDVIDKLLM